MTVRELGVGLVAARALVADEDEVAESEATAGLEVPCLNRNRTVMCCWVSV